MHNGTKVMYAQALWDLSARSSLDKITVSDVIKQAGTARQTFYNYFSDRNSLIEYVLTLWLQSSSRGFPASKTWLGCLRCAAAFVADHKGFFTDYVQLSYAKTSDYSLIDALCDHIRSLIHPGTASSDEDILSAVRFYSYGLSGLLYEWITGGFERSVNDISLTAYKCLPQNLKKYLGGMVIMQPEHRDGIETILASRFYLYQVLNLIFGSEPNSELIRILGDNETTETIELFSRDEKDDVHNFAEYLSAMVSRQDDEDYLEELRNEYTRLFVGPGKLPAYPWESMYVGKEMMLFQESTLAVRKIYGKYGYRALEYQQVADDHIGLMMGFMANMSQRAYAAFHDGIYLRAIELLSAQQNFLNTHMRNWIPRYAEALRKVPRPILYAQTATALCAILETDDIYLSEIQQELSEEV